MSNQDFELSILTDVPRPIKDDTLQVLKYVHSLENFIKINRRKIKLDK